MNHGHVTRIGVLGAAGRMGAEVCRAVDRAEGLDLVAAIDPGAVGRPVREIADVGVDLAVVGDPGDGQEIDVLVDFTQLDAARENLAWAADHGVHAVVGTSGFDDDDLDSFEKTFTTSNCLIAPNFAIGAVLMMRFAELAAPHFETAEVIELHHDGKVDSPSGTAMRTVERMAAASTGWGEDPTTHHTLAGARGGEGPGGIRVHSVRMRGMVAHQEVILGTTGQTLSIRHDTTDRTSFMPGVLLACRHIDEHPGLTVGLDALLGL